MPMNKLLDVLSRKMAQVTRQRYEQSGMILWGIDYSSSFHDIHRKTFVYFLFYLPQR
jgi:hypothetical protein